MAAIAVRAPELALTTDETKVLAGAITDVAKHYPHNIDAKMIAWSNLMMVALGLYGSRAFAIYTRVKSTSEKEKTPPASNVVAHPFNTVAG